MSFRSVATRTTAALLALAVLLPLAFPPVAHARTQGTRWVTKQLLWNGTAKQKTFTASLDDTAYVQLPNNIDWSAIDQSATINAQVIVAFVVKGANVANADTVHYVAQRGAGGQYAPIVIRDVAVAITNTAIQYGGSGMVFTGNIQTNPVGSTRSIASPSPNQNMRLKVCGDPDGILNSLECWVTYPETPVSSNPTQWVTVPLRWNNGSFSRTFAAAQTDTAFLVLPPDIDWGCVDVVVGANTQLIVDFARTTGASAADTVRYCYQPGFGGVFPFYDYRDQTPATTNTAVMVGGAGSGALIPGAVFTGFLVSNSNGRGVGIATYSQSARLKVQGDPNGILTGVTAFLTYPKQR